MKESSLHGRLNFQHLSLINNLAHRNSSWFHRFLLFVVHVVMYQSENGLLGMVSNQRFMFSGYLLTVYSFLAAYFDDPKL